MGYETQVEFVDVSLRTTRFAEFLNDVDQHRNDSALPFSWMFAQLRIDTEEGYLDWHGEVDIPRLFKAGWLRH